MSGSSVSFALVSRFVPACFLACFPLFPRLFPFLTGKRAAPAWPAAGFAHAKSVPVVPRALRHSGYSMDREPGHRASACNFVQDLALPPA
ncbi:hypothetical protein BUPH_00883 [Paraburkholderia phenoliruptrix BR3459a]|uniref:Uncharacterized protein n=1 Tax=Paraburkholderia phenoliruptrix BR3459a TaxID=1229205 RepID=K0DWG6_9BURK|nr:hypothetical protein BUPH_00883 [Paraburkholderia phenoliruptrix BR3459a]